MALFWIMRLTLWAVVKAECEHKDGSTCREEGDCWFRLIAEWV